MDYLSSKDDTDAKRTETEVIRQRCKDIPVMYRDVYRRGRGGRSRTAAVRAFCLECVGWYAPGVVDCTSPACPLFPYRQEAGDSRAGVRKR